MSVERVTETQLSIGATTVQTVAALPVEEEWATPATQQDPTPQQPDPLIDPRLQTTDEPFPLIHSPGESQIQLSEYPSDVLETESATRDADAWLDSMFNGNGDEWVPDTTNETPSPTTSAASEPEIMNGKIFKGCKCPKHQQLYDDWPARDAELTIAKCMTYNVQKSRDVVLASLFRDRWITEYDIIAVQEPWRNPFIATSYHPLKAHFDLVYLNSTETRVCFYVNKRVDASTWNASFITKDIITLEIVHPTLHHKLSIINVYNKVGTDTLLELRNTIAVLSTDSEVMLLGDFNLHHPFWSPMHRPPDRRLNACQPLLAIIEDFQLHLLTVPGTTTHRWKDGETTIDLTFGSEGVASRTIYCRVDTSRDCDSDHLPIATAITWDWQPTIPSMKRLWAKTNRLTLRQTVKDELAKEQHAQDKELTDNDQIDKYVQFIVDALRAGIDASTPQSNPSPHSVPGFDSGCKKICREVQQLRRQWQRTRFGKQL